MELSDFTTVIMTVTQDASKVDSSGGLDPADLYKCDVYQLIWYTVFGGILCILGVCGNIVSIFIFEKDPKKSSTTFLFQGLAVVDTFLLVLIFPVYSLPALIHFFGARHFALFVFPYIAVYLFPWAYYAQSCAVWVTVLVGVNRYIAVCYPYKAPEWGTIRRAKYLLAIVLILAFIYNIPSFITKRVSTRFDAELNMTVPFPDSTMRGVAEIIYYNILYSIVMLIIPLCTLVTLSVRLIKELKQVEMRRKTMVSTDRTDRAESNVTLTLVTVLIVFSICQAPALFTQIFWSILSDAQRECGGFQFYWSPLANCLVMLNSSINFALYFTTNTKFRRTFCTVLLKRPPQEPHMRTATTQNGTGASETLITQL